MSWGKTLQGMLQAVEAAQAGGRVEYAASDPNDASWRMAGLAHQLGHDTFHGSTVGDRHWIRIGSGRIDVVPSTT